MGWVKQQRNRRIVKNTMEYPEHAQPKYEWYMSTVPSKSDEHGQFLSAYVVFKCVGWEKNYADFGSVELNDPEFSSKWRALISRAKVVIDTLNSQPVDATLCAECSERVYDDHYLCDEHRAKQHNSTPETV